MKTRYTDPALTAAIGSPEHRAVARECVRESLVLLKNDNHALPLSRTSSTSPSSARAADDLGMQCGGWTIDWQGQPGECHARRHDHPGRDPQDRCAGTQVTFSPDGGDVKDADAVIVVVGELPYAEMKGDRSDLRLSPPDVALVEKAKAAGAPVVTILFSGRPLILGAALDASDAFIAAWLPGTEGQGVADVLFGDYKPTGKLPRAWPRDNNGLATLVVQPSASAPLFPQGFSSNN